MIDFKLIAGTNIGLRENNEDNFTVCADLAKNDWRIPVNYQEEIKLGDLGCIMVVADGMGGQNAGEVASSIAIETVHSMFSPEVLPKGIKTSDDSIDDYLKKVICAADVRVKKMTHENPSTSGMGSTIVIAWIIGDRAHIAWLGDSRAYCINKDKGIARLTKDHSYVQSLVDAGRITDEQALTHPDSNIINRSLGDTSQKAKPDVVSIELTEGSVILLCTDGLCGVCPDSLIGGLVEDNITDLKKCREELTAAALASGGSDNITITMLHVCKCDVTAPDAPVEKTSPRRKMKWNLLIYVLLLAIIGVLAFFLVSEEKPKQEQPKVEIVSDDPKDDVRPIDKNPVEGISNDEITEHKEADSKEIVKGENTQIDTEGDGTFIESIIPENVPDLTPIEDESDNSLNELPDPESEAKAAHDNGVDTVTVQTSPTDTLLKQN